MIAQRNILLADDSPDDAELTLISLRKTADSLSVEVMHDGVEVLNYLGIGPDPAALSELPLLILLDLKMPRLDGFSVLSRLKTDAILRRIPVVMLTSSQEPEDISACYQLGANAYVVKSMEFGRYADTLDAVQRFWVGANQIAR